MLRKIKLCLYRLNMIKTDTLLQKIEYLILKGDLSLYSSLFRSKKGLFIDRDILSYIQYLKYINEYDLVSSYITIKPITPNTQIVLTYAAWCTDNKRMLVDEVNVMTEWLVEAKLLIETAEVAKNAYSMNVYYTNYRKYSPYVTNITNIVNDIWSDLNHILLK